MTGLPISSIVIALAVILVVGACLMAWGLRGKRIGDVPYCRKCGYNLTGLESERCPECASEIGEKTVVVGTRQRRRGVIAISGLLLLFSAGGLGIFVYGRAKNIDWIRYYPVGQLMRMAERDDASALSELVRRATNQSLSESKAKELVPRILAKHGQDPVPPNITDWASLLFLLNQSGQMSVEQRDQFLGKVAHFDLRVRERIRKGDGHFVAVWLEDRGCSNLKGILYWKLVGPFIDGHPLWFEEHRWDGVSLGGLEGSAFTMFGGGPYSLGVHVVECSLTIGAFKRDEDPECSSPFWSETLTLSAEFEVLANDQRDPIRFTSDDSIAGILENVLQVRRLAQYLDEHDEPRYSSLWLDLKQPVPVRLAFDAFAVGEGVEVFLGSYGWRKGQVGFRGGRRTTRRTSRMALPERVSVELRPSRDFASQTLDGYEFWGGTVFLGTVEVAKERSP